MIKLKPLFLFCALSFFTINLAFSVYFFYTKDVSSYFSTEQKINYSDEIGIYFPDIDDLVFTEINPNTFAINGVINKNETIYNLVNYFIDAHVEINTLIIEPTKSSQRSMNIKLVLKK